MKLRYCQKTEVTKQVAAMVAGSRVAINVQAVYVARTIASHADLTKGNFFGVSELGTLGDTFCIRLSRCPWARLLWCQADIFAEDGVAVLHDGHTDDSLLGTGTH